MSAESDDDFQSCESSEEIELEFSTSNLTEGLFAGLLDCGCKLRCIDKLGREYAFKLWKHFTDLNEKERALAVHYYY